MEGVKQFFIANWQLIASVAVFILATTVGLIRSKKKGANILGYLLGLLCEELPSLIRESEQRGGTPDQKKVWVLNKALNFASQQFGRSLTEQESAFIVSKVSEQIESVLSTPQKKQVEKLEVKQNAKYR